MAWLYGGFHQWDYPTIDGFNGWFMALFFPNSESLGPSAIGHRSRSRSEQPNPHCTRFPGSQEQLLKGSQKQVPKVPRKRFSSKVPRNRFPSKVPKQGSPARFSGTSYQRFPRTGSQGRFERNRFPSKVPQVPKQDSQGLFSENMFPSKLPKQIPRNLIPSKGARNRYPKVRKNRFTRFRKQGSHAIGSQARFSRNRFPMGPKGSQEQVANNRFPSKVPKKQVPRNRFPRTGCSCSRERLPQNNFNPQFDAFLGPRRRFAPGLAHEWQSESQGILFSNTEVFILRFYTEKCLHREAFTQSNFTHRSLYTEKPFLKEAFPHKAFSNRSFYTEKLLRTEL